MLPRLTTAFAAVCALIVAGCASTPTPGPFAPAARPPVILISIDGFRWDYLQRGVTPTLNALVAEGASGPMRPSFPSVTFPNHYTLVTGKHPDHHGIVSNAMVDAELGRFALDVPEAVTDRRWWDQAEPIWVTAEKAGLVTGTMFWPGSEAAIGGVRPTYWTRFDQSLPGDARVDQVLAWLDLPPPERPALATLYFDIVDTAGHENGPDAAGTVEALASVDASIARLIAGLKARGLEDDAVLVIVSDHGMAATSPERVIQLDDLVDPEALRIVYTGAVTFLDPVPGREAEVETALVGRHPHAECWRKADIPARFVLGSNPRVAAIVCSPEVGWLIATRARPVTRSGGAHGYDNAAPEMRALFIAHGPGVARGIRVGDLDSVDVQPLLGRLLGLAVPPGDGRAGDTAAALID
ncbi:ectonucleotide pyrophosphatase/phosphodiesterase [Brevundimonas sp.]|uniref:alkaline phosphatase family protein n=1 Tax=Brevundimonas sp. TaxID=1871086 RepID=UPI00272FE261|nr:ectonucleotide pyrophosphatase/phosphodiesterase [Brevundimonas sp.]MDP1914552.1 ectonucleotide pyrophosphatase/phosphodiesterase [Brevundimonas sp.]